MSETEAPIKYRVTKYIGGEPHVRIYTRDRYLRFLRFAERVNYAAFDVEEVDQ